jgi:adenylate cyclase
MGRVVLRGRKKPVDVFEAAPDFPDSERRALEQAIALLETDRPTAIHLVEEISQRNPADIAVKNLLRRCTELNEEGAYVLG